MKIVSNKIRASARGELCTFQIAGVCNYDRETTVLCHLPDESNGWGQKASDHCAAYGCSACHDCIDRRSGPVLSGEDREFYMRRAMVRTWRRLLAKRVITIADVSHDTIQHNTEGMF